MYPETRGVPLEEMDAVFGEGKCSTMYFPSCFYSRPHRGAGGTPGRRSFGAWVFVVSAVQPIPPKPYQNSEPWACESPNESQQWAIELRAHRGQRRIGTREDEQQQCSRGRSPGPDAPASNACCPLGRQRRRRLVSCFEAWRDDVLYDYAQ